MYNSMYQHNLKDQLEIWSLTEIVRVPRIVPKSCIAPFPVILLILPIFKLMTSAIVTSTRLQVERFQGGVCADQSLEHFDQATSGSDYLLEIEFWLIRITFNDQSDTGKHNSDNIYVVQRLIREW